MSWKTKPTDRFVLRFIKIYFSAPLSTALVQVVPEVRPIVLTFTAVFLGISGGVAFGLGLAWVGGLLAAVAQVLDGVDGQVARLTGKVSSVGAFLGAAVGGLVLSSGWLIVIAALAAAGSSQPSYATARAASLQLDYPRPEYAGKGSRTTVIVICGLLTPIWIHFPLVALIYLALHPNIAVLLSLLRVKDNNAG
jgi:phosphatidylglycerophosphate synthase